MTRRVFLAIGETLPLALSANEGRQGLALSASGRRGGVVVGTGTAI